VPLVSHPPTATVSSGMLRGGALTEADASLGVPYAAAPFGAHRMRPPRPVPPWRGVHHDAALPAPGSGRGVGRRGLADGLPAGPAVPTWSPGGCGTTSMMIDTRTAKQPADLVVSQINGLLFGLSGRQDL